MMRMKAAEISYVQETAKDDLLLLQLWSDFSLASRPCQCFCDYKAILGIFVGWNLAFFFFTGILNTKTLIILENNFRPVTFFSYVWFRQTRHVAVLKNQC